MNYFDVSVEDNLAIHNDDMQLQEQASSRSLEILSSDKKSYQCTLADDMDADIEYHASLESCDCYYFATYNLPCRHMYKAAHKFQLYGFPRDVRKTDLIADFSKGYADGWKFLVKTCHLPALDILWTQRIVKKETSSGIVKKEKSSELTQGNHYNFHEGSSFDSYNDKASYYKTWGDALKDMTCSIQIDNVEPARTETVVKIRGNKFTSINTVVDEGIVSFSLYVPNMEKTKLEKISEHKCTHKAFVDLLKSGTTLDIKGRKLIVP